MRRRRSLSGEERELWTSVARTATPLPGRAALPASVPQAPTASAEVPPPPTVSIAANVVARPKPSTPAAPSLHPIERPVRRKLSRGHLPIDARIDLHGRTEAIAHQVLLGFLRRAQGEGSRHVLVITGRGASFGSTGTLRRALPLWFSTYEFRALVAGYEPAERRHGGDGAFYVRIRRR